MLADSTLPKFYVKALWSSGRGLFNMSCSQTLNVPSFLIPVMSCICWAQPPSITSRANHFDLIGFIILVQDL